MNYSYSLLLRSRDGVVVRALAFLQCGTGPISRPDVICDLRLSVLYSVLRGFSLQVLQFSPLAKNQH